MTEHASFLRLERYRLRELSARDERSVAEHLASCAPCRACLAEVEREIALPQLPSLPERREQATSGVNDLRALRDEIARAEWRKRALLGSQISGALALAAAALLILQPQLGPGVEPPAQRRTIKGGDVAIELVRKRGDAIASGADTFVEGDAFKVLLTCPPPLTPRFDVVVYQAGQAYFPLERGALTSCGNRQALAGAFTLDGQDDALVCVALGEQHVPTRSVLSQGPEGLPELSVCARLSRQ